MNILHKILVGLYVGVLLSTLSVAQAAFDSPGVSESNSDDTMQGWKPVCVLPSCNPGGSGIPTSTAHTVGHSTPSKDGGAMMVSITGPQYSNALWTYRAGADDSATHVSLSFWVYPTAAASTAGSFEYDLFNFDKSMNVEFMWGTQCNQASHLWQVFDQLHGHWMNTSTSCALAANKWHQVRWDVHRVSGDTNRCSGKPCMYYDTLTVDGVPHNINAMYPAGSMPGGWSSAVGFQFQIDIGKTSQHVTINEYFDLVDFTAM